MLSLFCFTANVIVFIDSHSFTCHRIERNQQMNEHTRRKKTTRFISRICWADGAHARWWEFRVLFLFIIFVDFNVVIVFDYVWHNDKCDFSTLSIIILNSAFFFYFFCASLHYFCFRDIVWQKRNIDSYHKHLFCVLFDFVTDFDSNHSSNWNSYEFFHETCNQWLIDCFHINILPLLLGSITFCFVYIYSIFQSDNRFIVVPNVAKLTESSLFLVDFYVFFL